MPDLRNTDSFLSSGASPPFGRYQIILLDDRGTYVCEKLVPCPCSLSESTATGMRTCNLTCQSQIQHPLLRYQATCGHANGSKTGKKYSHNFLPSTMTKSAKLESEKQFHAGKTALSVVLTHSSTEKVQDEFCSMMLHVAVRRTVHGWITWISTVKRYVCWQSVPLRYVVLISRRGRCY